MSRICDYQLRFFYGAFSCLCCRRYMLTSILMTIIAVHFLRPDNFVADFIQNSLKTSANTPTGLGPWLLKYVV